MCIRSWSVGFSNVARARNEYACRFPALLAAMRELGYRGWIIVESDKGPAPQATSMMLNSWYVQRVLKSLSAFREVT
jgi:sugar phosphate isomerase/epimerase